MGARHIIRILPTCRDVFTTSHRAHATDFEEVKWLLQYGTTETWYEKPSNALIQRMRLATEAGSEPDELVPCAIRVIENHTPKIWASAALTTPLDDGVIGCRCHADQTTEKPRRPCGSCTDAKFEALKAMDLTYYLVFSSTQTLRSSGNDGAQVYRLFMCGSREAAVAETFHATGMKGWNLVFSCVTRGFEDFGRTARRIKRVENLWMLANCDIDDIDSDRVFY